MKLKLKIPIPENANVFAENGDKAANLLLYEVEQFEVLEEIKADTNSLHMHVKDGQYINKGDVIFTEGFLGHKVMVSDFSGIIELKANRLRILGQKEHFERKINLNGKVVRIVPNQFIELECEAEVVKPAFYSSFQNRLTGILYYKNKEDISHDDFRFAGSDITLFINDNIYVEELAKVVAFGAKRVIVNAVFVNDLTVLKREIDKLDGFAVLAGFGEVMSQKVQLKQAEHNIFWSKHGILISDELETTNHQIFEHPFWGISGNYHKQNELVGNLDYNRERFEFYLKNIEHT